MANLVFNQPIAWDPYRDGDVVDPGEVFSDRTEYTIVNTETNANQFVVVSTDTFQAQGFTARLKLVVTPQTTFTYGPDGLPVEPFAGIQAFAISEPPGLFTLPLASLTDLPDGITISTITSAAVFFEFADTFTGSSGGDLFDAGPGDDVMGGGGGNDVLGGGDGNDSLSGDTGRDTLFGGTGDDVLYGMNPGQIDTGGDVLLGDAGNDLLFGSGGDDFLYGGADTDTIVAGLGVNYADGGTGTDIIDFRDRTAGLWLDLDVDSVSTPDTWITLVDIEGMTGGQGGDVIFGDERVNSLFGGAGNDFIDGRTEGDDIYGQDGDDYLRGGDGLDRLNGGAGVDALEGGAGADVFNLDVAAGWDVVVDFNTAEDLFALGGQSFEFINVGDYNGDGTNDTGLTYSGGTVVVFGVSGLSLESWNDLVIVI